MVFAEVGILKRGVFTITFFKCPFIIIHFLLPEAVPYLLCSVLPSFRQMVTGAMQLHILSFHEL